MLTRVSNIEAYRKWLNWKPLFDGDEEPSLDDLVRQLTVDEPSEKMQAGTAFHAALERAGDGAHETFVAMGYRFELPDADLALPALRELRAFKTYGDLQVTGKVDCLDGKIVEDHKTTSKVDFERYLEGCQWRFYLDIFEANVFQWHIFELKELEPKVYRVSAPQILRAVRYPELHQDCVRMAEEYLAFARQMNLPDARID